MNKVEIFAGFEINDDPQKCGLRFLKVQSDS